MSTILEDRLRKGIELIRSKVIEMGTRAEQATAASLRALVERDRRLAYAIILRDSEIDDLEKELDRLCLEFLVRQQPAAGHLRSVYAAIKINTELERIGDYAESVARQALFLDPAEKTPCAERFIEIGELARKMLHDAIEAFVNRDPDLARATTELERQVDAIRTQIRLDLLQQHREGKLEVEKVVPLLITGARFERVADQSVNICEEVLYMCTGEFFKHKGKEAFRVLFLSKGNSMRSQMAEGIANSLGLDSFVFSSAGITPRLVDQRTVEFMAEKGIDISHQTSKSIEQIPNLEHYQVIILLSREAEEAARPLPAKPIRLQWHTPDPSKAKGTPEEVHAGYEKAFDYINTHIRDFVDAVLSDEAYP
jgi:phosphate transport system protein